LRLADLLPRMTWPERSASGAYVLTCAMPFLAYRAFGLYASMAPLFLAQMLPWHGPIVSGRAIAALLLLSATTQILAGPLSVHWCGFLGMASLATANALLVLNLQLGSSLVFSFGVLFTALGHGMGMLSGMSMINRIASPHNRSGL